MNETKQGGDYIHGGTDGTNWRVSFLSKSRVQYTVGALLIHPLSLSLCHSSFFLAFYIFQVDVATISRENKSARRGVYPFLACARVKRNFVFV
jgi:hypothetical protein